MRCTKNKILSFFLSIIIVISISPTLKLNAATVASGKCGTNLTWKVDDNGTLTISGSGEMDDFDWNEETELPETPWVEYLNAIKSVVISGNVTSIGAEAFDECKNLKSVTISNTVTSIGSYSFEHCYALTSITIPNSVTEIYDYAFCDCINLKSIKLSTKLKDINEGVFQYCEKLNSITIPDSVKTIGYGAFNGAALSNVIFPDSITFIDEYAFSGCNFVSLDLPKNITKISEGAFSDCFYLSQITIPGKVTSIDAFAFANNVSMTNASIPLSVKTIDPEAFSGCENLSDIYYSGSKTQFYQINGHDSLLTYFNVHYNVTPLKITAQPVDYTGIIGSTAVYKVTAQGTGLKYQWQTYSNGKWSNSSLPGYNTTSLSVPVIASRNGYIFRCVVKDSNNQSVITNVALLKITSIMISSQPKDYSGTVGSTAKFSIIAQGTGLKYQWQTYNNGKWTNSSLPGYNTATLSVPVIASRNGYKFRCVVTDSSNKTVTSNAATLSVTAYTAVSILTQPKDYTSSAGNTATFKVVAQGSGLKYQWQTYSNGKWVNSSLPGYNTATLSVPVISSRNGYKFRCVVTDSGNKTATSGTATLRVVAPGELAIVSQPDNVMGSVGATAKFKVVAQGTGLKYQWQTYKDGKWVNSQLPGFNTAELSVGITNARNGYKFRCVITDAGGKTITSNDVYLKVKN